MSVLLRGARLIDPHIKLDQVADILLGNNGEISQVGPSIDTKAADEVRDMANSIIVPGLVDIHVHLRDPGLEYKEDIASGSRAAAHGGFTDVVAMPNTVPCCDTGSCVAYVRKKAAQLAHTRIHQAGSLTKGIEGKELSEMGDMAQEGACAFTDDGRGVQDAGVMRRCMEYAKQFDVPVFSHCETESLVGEGVVNEGVVSTRLGVAGWPVEGENLQIARDIMLCQLTGCPLHIQHVTSKSGIELIAQAKAKELPVTCEVTPHHLFLCEDDISNEYNTALKTNPPLRSKEDMLALQEALVDGVIDVIATDHAPHALHEKDREFELAPFGTTGLETSLSLVLTNLVHTGKIGYDRMVEVMAQKPRDIVHLPKVHLAPGFPADITVINPTKTWVVDKKYFVSKSSNSAFVGWKLKGMATDVYVGGKASLIDGVPCE